MPLITCPDCNKEISDSAKTCIHCGRPMILKQSHFFIPKKVNYSKVTLKISAIILTLTIVSFFYHLICLSYLKENAISVIGTYSNSKYEMNYFTNKITIIDLMEIGDSIDEFDAYLVASDLYKERFIEVNHDWERILNKEAKDFYDLYAMVIPYKVEYELRPHFAEAKTTEVKAKQDPLESNELDQSEEGLYQLAFEQNKEYLFDLSNTTINTLVSNYPSSPKIKEATQIYQKNLEGIAYNQLRFIKDDYETSNWSECISGIESFLIEFRTTSYITEAIQLLEECRKAQKRKPSSNSDNIYKQPDTSEYLLDLTAYKWEHESGYAIVKGTVKNRTITSIKNIEAVATFYDASGKYITHGSALIEYDPLLSGQESPFEVLEKWNPEMRSMEVKFKTMFGGELPTRTKWYY